MNPLKLLLLAAVALGAWYFFTHFNVHVEPRSALPVVPGTTNPSPPPAANFKPAIRIASLNCGPLDERKLANPLLAGRIAQILRQYDVIALQDVQARDQGLLVRLVELVNSQGGHYDCAAAPSVGRDSLRQYSAFVFDAATVEVDRNMVALVQDRGGAFTHAPLVAAMRARGPSPQEAFTFTLINVHIPADRASVELPLLATVFRAVRDNGRNEDDVLILGELGIDDAHLEDFARLPNLACAISGLPTTTRGNRMLDNLLFDRRATCEFMHRAGVADLVRELGLSPQEAAEVSEHLPVWAEFSVYEGGQAGVARIAE